MQQCFVCVCKLNDSYITGNNVNNNAIIDVKEATRNLAVKFNQKDCYMMLNATC